MTALSALISRLEGGETGREMADQVLLACGWECRPTTAIGTPTKEWCRIGGHRHDWVYSPPNPLTSLDAAMELVPEGGWWDVVSDGFARVELDLGGEFRDFFDGGCKGKPAAALTIACLKARIEHDKIGETE